MGPCLCHSWSLNCIYKLFKFDIRPRIISEGDLKNIGNFKSTSSLFSKCVGGKFKTSDDFSQWLCEIKMWTAKSKNRTHKFLDRNLKYAVIFIKENIWKDTISSRRISEGLTSKEEDRKILNCIESFSLQHVVHIALRFNFDW